MKGLKKCVSLKILLGILFCTLSVGLFTGYSANAQSDFDDRIKHTSNLELTCEGGNRDVTTTYAQYLNGWLDYAIDNGSTTAQQAKQMLQANLNVGSGWLVQTRNHNGLEKGFTFMIFEPSADVTFDTSNYYGSSSGTGYVVNFSHGTFYKIRIQGRNTLDCDSSDYSTINGSIHVNDTYDLNYWSSGQGVIEKFFLIASNNVQYPQDYDGDIIPQSHIPLVESNWTPDIKLHKGDDWNVELSDYNFFTFDRVAFTCGDEGFAPLIDWSIYDITGGNNDLIDTMTFSASAQVNFQAPKIQENKRYNIVAKYSGCDNTVFMNSSNHEFTVRKDGTLNPPDYMAVCIREDFPFINIPDCLGELDSFFATITFRIPNEKNISGGGWATLVNGCRELQVVGSWIFSQGKTVCPQFSSTVRGIMTPIVTFALALGVITFISNRQGLRSI